MPTKTYAIVNVSMRDGKLTCTPDWVHLYWKNGPADIRWVFDGAPPSAVGAVVQFLEAVPAKYPTPPSVPGGFRPRGVHRGFGSAPASAGSPLPDLVTSANTEEAGYFYYDVQLVDGDGNVLAQADPGGDNQPTGP